MMFNWRDCYVGYLNRDDRTDRFDHINIQLSKLGIPFYRTRGGLPSEYDMDDPSHKVMANRTPGAIPCYHGQLEIMENALNVNKSVMVFEDDALLCEDIILRLDYIEKFLNKTSDWSWCWLGGTVHIPEAKWRTGNNPDLLGFDLGKDAEPTDDPRMIKCYSAFSTFAYIVNWYKLEEVITKLKKVMHLSMGIDFSAIYLGEELPGYMFLPGVCRQIDNLSNIGNGMTYFSGFASLGDYWYQEKMEDFDPTTIKW